MRRFFDHVKIVMVVGLVPTLGIKTAAADAPAFTSPTFVLKWGSEGSGPGQFHTCNGVAVGPDGLVYVTDDENDRVEVFTPSGGFVRQWSTQGNHLPIALAITAGGDVIVAGEGSNSVGRFSPYGQLLSQWGTSGSGDGQFTLPYGVAVDTQGRVYVVDRGNRVERFTLQGQFIDQWGSGGAGPGQFNGPSGIAIDSQGFVYVADTFNNRVQKFDPSGTYIAQWPTGRVFGLAVDELDHIWVSINGCLGSPCPEIWIYSATGDAIGYFGGYGTGDGQFNFPFGIASDGHGLIYIADPNARRVQKFRTAGAQISPPPFVLKWGSQGGGPGQFADPVAVAVGPQDQVYVADYNSDRIERFSPNGGFVGQWQLGPGSSYYPLGVTTDAVGNVYVASNGHNYVQKFSAGGDLLQTFNGLFQPHALAVAANGNVVVADTRNYRVVVFDPQGNIETTWGTQGSGNSQFDWLYDLALDQAGNVYTVDMNANRIQKFSSDGTFIRSWGSLGSGPGEFNVPTGITIGSDGLVYIDDSQNHRIQVFDSNGAYLASWGELGSANGQFQGNDRLGHDEHGNILVADETNFRIQKFGPGPGLRPLILVHGICSDGNMWSTFAPSLASQGFEIHVGAFTDANARPQKEAADLEKYLRDNFPNQDVDVVAHSMGGLVSREYIARQKDHGLPNRIRTLITLGTPHHGSDFYRVSTKFIFQHPLLTLIPKISCRLLTGAAQDMKPGSGFLNGLNYGGARSRWDSAKARSWEGQCAAEHCAEDLRDNTATFVAVGGSGGLNPIAEVVLGGVIGNIWTGDDGTYHPNDGAVVLESSLLADNEHAHSYSDLDLGLGPFSHSPGLLFGHVAYSESAELLATVANALRGVLPSANPSPALLTTRGPRNTNLGLRLTDLPSVGVALPPGSAAELPFHVPSTASLRVLAAVDHADLRLRKPNGVLLTSADTISVPGLRYGENPQLGLLGFRVADPDSGNWHIVFDGSASDSAQDVEALIQVESAFAVHIEAVDPKTVLGGLVQIVASIDSLGTTVPGVSWQTTVTRPDSTTFPLELYDDGAHQDGIIGDGVFSGSFQASGPSGFYRIGAQALLGSNGTVYSNVADVELVPYEDLAVDSTLSFDKNPISAGDSLTVTAIVRNLGSAVVDSVRVELWDNHAERAYVYVTIGIGASALVSLPWRVALPDTHLVQVVVNPFTVVDDANTGNDVAAQAVVLGQGIVDVEPRVDINRLALSPPRPNPSNGGMQFSFSLPTAGLVTLDLYDVRGRLLGHWGWPRVEAGGHVVPWDGRADTGQLLGPGVIFIRLRANGQTMTGKAVRLQ